MSKQSGIVLITVWILASVGLHAQQTTATILGTIKDQSEAVLPGANITATNLETGFSRSAVSGSRGEYRIPALGLGNYDVSVNMSGFEAAKRSGITLSVGQEAV